MDGNESCKIDDCAFEAFQGLLKVILEDKK